MKKILNVIMIMLLLSTILTINHIATAGEEKNPEIIDAGNDTLLNHYDILSAWFHEVEDESGYLFISIKVNSLSTIWLGGTYLVEWASTSGRFASGSMIGMGIMNNSWRCGDYSKGSYTKFDDLIPCEGSFNTDTNIITWKIPKSEIGNLKTGDLLSNTKAVSCITGRYLMLLPFRGLPRLHDYAPDSGYGFDYEIKY